MILVLENEVEHEFRGLAHEITRLTPEGRYYDFIADPHGVDLDVVDGVIFTGSTAHIYESGNEEWIDPATQLVNECIDAAIPVLGVCFGHQLVNAALGGTVEPDEERTRLVELTEYENTGVLAGINPVVPVLHGDVVTESGAGLRVIGQTTYDPQFCTAHETAPAWTVQFHPEFTMDFAAQWETEIEFSTDGYSWDQVNSPRVFTTFAEICLEDVQPVHQSG